MTEVIATQNLSKKYKDVSAVEDLTLSVHEGEIFGFLGPNGAGKTTTIRLLLGLLEPSEGHAKVLGYDISKESDRIRASTGALLEHPGLYERLSADDNLRFYGHIWHLADQALNDRSAGALSEKTRHRGVPARHALCLVYR